VRTARKRPEKWLMFTTSENSHAQSSLIVENHYPSLGVKHFVFLANDSIDETVEMLRAEGQRHRATNRCHRVRVRDQQTS
jgi:hypothetical protein